MALGPKNIELVLEKIQSGKLKIEKVKLISLKMNGKVHGVFAEKTRHPQIELVVVMRYMIDQ